MDICDMRFQALFAGLPKVNPQRTKFSPPNVVVRACLVVLRERERAKTKEAEVRVLPFSFFFLSIILFSLSFYPFFLIFYISFLSLIRVRYLIPTKHTHTLSLLSVSPSLSFSVRAKFSLGRYEAKIPIVVLSSLLSLVVLFFPFFLVCLLSFFFLRSNNRRKHVFVQWSSSLPPFRSAFLSWNVSCIEFLLF